MGSRFLAVLKSPWGVVLRTVVSVALVALFLARIDYQKLGILVSSISAWRVAALGALAAARNVIGAWRSRVVVVDTSGCAVFAYGGDSSHPASLLFRSRMPVRAAYLSRLNLERGTANPKMQCLASFGGELNASLRPPKVPTQ